MQTAAKRLGLETIAVECSTENEIETAFAFLERQGAGAVYLGSDLFLLSQRQRIAALALRHKLPTVSPWRSHPAIAIEEYPSVRQMPAGG